MALILDEDDNEGDNVVGFVDDVDDDDADVDDERFMDEADVDDD